MKQFVVGIIGIAMMLLYAVSASYAAEPLKVYYLERPPYYYTEHHHARGILVDRTRRILADAAVDAVFIPMPPKRILRILKNSSEKACSIGWFKTKERKRFARFSLPIYQNRPLVLLARKDTAAKISPNGRPVALKRVFLQKSLVMGRVVGFSYGEYVDRGIKQHADFRFETAPNQKDLIRMLASGRISYLLVAPEEVDTLLKQTNSPPAKFDVIHLSDIPRGNKRYLIFDRSIDQKTIARINRSIAKNIRLKARP